MKDFDIVLSCLFTFIISRFSSDAFCCVLFKKEILLYACSLTTPKLLPLGQIYAHMLLILDTYIHLYNVYNYALSIKGPTNLDEACRIARK